MPGDEGVASTKVMETLATKNNADESEKPDVPYASDSDATTNTDSGNNGGAGGTANNIPKDEQETFDVTYEVEPEEGANIVNADTTVKTGETLEFTVRVNKGYELDTVLVCGDAVEPTEEKDNKYSYEAANIMRAPKVEVYLNKKAEFTYTETIDGVTLTLTAKEDVVPEGTKVSIQKLDDVEDDLVVEEVKEAVLKEAKVEEPAQYQAYQIQFVDSDTDELIDEIDGEVTVQISGLEDPSDLEEEAVDEPEVYEINREMVSLMSETRSKKAESNVEIEKVTSKVPEEKEADLQFETKNNLVEFAVLSKSTEIPSEGAKAYFYIQTAQNAGGDNYNTNGFRYMGEGKVKLPDSMDNDLIDTFYQQRKTISDLDEFLLEEPNLENNTTQPDYDKFGYPILELSGNQYYYGEKHPEEEYKYTYEWKTYILEHGANDWNPNHAIADAPERAWHVDGVTTLINPGAVTINFYVDNQDGYPEFKTMYFWDKQNEELTDEMRSTAVDAIVTKLTTENPASESYQLNWYIEENNTPIEYNQENLIETANKEDIKSFNICGRYERNPDEWSLITFNEGEYGKFDLTDDTDRDGLIKIYVQNGQNIDREQIPQPTPNQYWTFRGWMVDEGEGLVDPAAEPITQPMTYTAVYTPMNDSNKDGIPDEEQYIITFTVDPEKYEFLTEEYEGNEKVVVGENTLSFYYNSEDELEAEPKVNDLTTTATGKPDNRTFDYFAYEKSD